MSDVVQVFRYIRPSQFWDDTFSNEPNYGWYSNLYGITIVYDLDYENQQVIARWSICNGDNFSKEEGRKRALSSKKVVTFPLELVDEMGSLTEALVSVLDSKYSNISPFLFEEYLKTFLKASRNL